MAFVAMALFQVGRHQDRVSISEGGRIVSRALLFFLFVFQSAYVHFLYTQHMSFIGSVLSPEEGQLWFAPIAGVGSIMSTLSAGSISSFVDKIGVTGLLLIASITIGISGILGHVAYGIAARNGFEPTDGDSPERDAKPTGLDGKKHGSGAAREAMVLLRRVPALGALFCEVVAAQAFSSLLNFLFLLKAKNIILDDGARAGFTGKVGGGLRCVF